MPDPATLLLLLGLAVGTADNEITHANLQPTHKYLCLNQNHSGNGRCGDWRDAVYSQGREYNTLLYGSHPSRVRLYGVLAGEAGSAYVLHRLLKRHKYLGLLPSLYVVGAHSYGLSFSLAHR